MADTNIVKGDTVTVEMRQRNIRLPALGHNVPDTVTYTGVVQASADYDETDSVRITGDGNMPVRVLAFKHIVSWNGEPFKFKASTKAPKKGKTEKPEVKTVAVTGSKGDTYTLTIYPDGRMTCSCKGFGFKGKCSHIDKYKENN
jgi:hypothetical protein